ncbi:MAG: benzoyl-CoA reductase subunit C [Acidobacteria bacterium]|nr:benzoyl-CoA reductase subunit C [Acidobacteriota bacterium]
MPETHVDPCGAVLERARALVEDRSLAHVRAWKTANPGALAIGYLPIYVPRPLFEALGCLPVALFGGGDELEIVRGDSYFQSYICHIPRSTLELGLSGHLDPLDGMVFPSICDVIRNLGGMWRMLFPDRYVAYLDIPQNFDMATGGRFFAHAMREIAEALGARGAKRLDAAALRRAIGGENARRASLERLDAIRRAEPWRLRASEAYLIARAGAGLPAATHRALVDEAVEAASRRPARLIDNARVVLRGSFCEQPPLDLIRSLEKAGCDIVDDDFQLGLRTIDGEIAVGEDEDPLDALARTYLQRGVATASRYIANDVKGAALVSRVRECGADGVVFAAASFCDPALLDQPMLEAALDRASIPHTSFKFAENNAQFQTIREQAGAFSDSVKLWGAER